MPRKFLRRFIPAPDAVKRQKWLGPLADRLHNPNIWHLNRHSVAGAVAIGLFMVFIPAPSQMVVAALLAIYFRVNLPIAAALVWISNPLTFGPIGLAALKLGEWLIGAQAGVAQFSLSWDWLLHELPKIWKPLMLGLMVMAVVSSVSGYWLTQCLWRWHVLSNYRQRRFRRQRKKEDHQIQKMK